MPQNQVREAGEGSSGEPTDRVGVAPLREDEVHPFLNFLFGDIARRPAVLDISRAADAVRFLQLLSAHGVPTAMAERGSSQARRFSEKSVPQRAFLADLAEAIWKKLFVFGSATPCNKLTAKAFLRKHASTYFAEFDTTRAFEILDELDIPQSALETLTQPTLMSRIMRAQGAISPRLRDDVSERIYAAFHALKAAKIKRRLHLIEETLAKFEVESRNEWTYKVVNDRLRRFGRSLYKHFEKEVGPVKAERVLQRWSATLANRWILAFRTWQRIGLT